jgi:hypothetical protein
MAQDDVLSEIHKDQGVDFEEHFWRKILFWSCTRRHLGYCTNQRGKNVAAKADGE